MFVHYDKEWETYDCAEVCMFFIGNDQNPVKTRDLVYNSDISSESSTTYGFYIDKAGSDIRVDVKKGGQTFSNVADGTSYTEKGRYTIETTSRFGEKYTSKLEVTDGLSMYALTPTVFGTDDDYEDWSVSQNTEYNAKSLTTLYLTQENEETITSYLEDSQPKYGTEGENLWLYLQLNYGHELTGNGWSLSSDSFGESKKDTIDGVLTGQVGEGALIIQTSTDGETWTNSDKSIYANGLYTTNYAEYYTPARKNLIYQPSGEEIINGMYIRVLFAFEIYNASEDESINYVEEYKFYLCSANLNAVSIHNLSVTEEMDEMLSDEDQISADIYKKAETLTNNTQTVTGFTIDTSLNPTARYEVYRNDVAVKTNENRFNETGKYDIYLKSAVGTQKHVTVYIDRETADESLKMYFGDSFISGKRIYSDGSYPFYEGGQTTYNIMDVSSDFLPLGGSITNLTTGNSITIEANSSSKTGTLSEPGEYIASFTTNSTFLTDAPCGDTKTFTFHFYVIEQGKAPGPVVNKNNLEQFGKSNVSDAFPRYYGVKYASASRGDIILAFATREAAYEYAYNYEKGSVEKQPDGSFRYTGSFVLEQKKLIYSGWDLADALDYYANQAVQELYFDLSVDYTYTTLSDDTIERNSNLRKLELDKSVVVFAEGQKDVSTGKNDYVILSPKPFRYVVPNQTNEVTSGYNDFQFVRDEKGYDSDSVYIIDCEGKKHTIEYLQDVGEQLQKDGCPTGKVTIVEKTVYGDETKYDAMFISKDDNTTQLELTCFSGTSTTNVAINANEIPQHFDVDAFKISSIVDQNDCFASVVITKDGEEIRHYIQNDYPDEMIASPGDYIVKCVNRLGYSYSFEISVNPNTDYTVIHFTGEETEQLSPIVTHIGDKNVALPTLSRKGYEFIGFKNSEEVVYTNCIEEIHFCGDVSLESVWKLKEYHLNFVDENNQALSSKNVTLGETVQLEMPVIPEGKEFVGWKCGTEIITNLEYCFTEEGDKTFVAVYKDISAEVSVTPVSDTGNSSSSSGWIVAVAAIAITGGATGVVAYRRKNSKPKEDNSNEIDNTNN